MPHTDQKVDVAIIGAGPAGLTAAYLLVLLLIATYGLKCAHLRR